MVCLGLWVGCLNSAANPTARPGGAAGCGIGQIKQAIKLVLAANQLRQTPPQGRAETAGIGAQAIDATMWESDAMFQAGAAEALAFDQAFKDILTGDTKAGANKQFAHYFETVFLAASMCVAQYAVGFNDFFEQHFIRTS